MLRQADNSVHIEGILSENNLQTRTYKKDGRDVNAIAGTVTIKVDTEVNGVMTPMEIQVHAFANQLTQEGKPSGLYDNLANAMKLVSIAACGDEARADKIRITGGRISMNEFYTAQNPERLNSIPQITASFINKVNPQSYEPIAEFSCEMVVANKIWEVDEEGVETGRLKVTGIIPGYKGRVDVVDFYTANASVSKVVDENWEQGNSVKFVGAVNFTTKIETSAQKNDFGQDLKLKKTKFITEFLITGGSREPLEEEFAFNMEEINAALAQRKQNLEAKKVTAKNKPAAGVAPAKNTGALNAMDLGF